jgi:hypothetical protein
LDVTLWGVMAFDYDQEINNFQETMENKLINDTKIVTILIQ